MNRLLSSSAITLLLSAIATPVSAQSLQLGFQETASSWRTVVDGVMGGRSTARVRTTDAQTLLFTGKLSLENNGGFSQMRTAVDGEKLAGAKGLTVVCRGDGRTYNFDIRVSNARMMAGGFQKSFETVADQWIEVELPFEEFKLFRFGRQMRNAPELNPRLIESIGVTLSDKVTGDFSLEIRSIDKLTVASSRRATGGDAGAGNDLATVAKNAGLSTLLELVEAAGLQLPNEPVTIFAPTNSAFAALPEGTVESLLERDNLKTLTEILGLHVVPGRIASSDLLRQKQVTTLLGQPITISLKKGKVTIGDKANLVATDIQAANGVIHLIDSVLLPSKPTPKASAAVTRPTGQRPDVSEGAAQIYALAINRGVGLFNDGNPEACAAVYELAVESMLRLAADQLSDKVRARLEQSRQEAKAATSWANRAWALRRALDDVYSMLRPIPSRAALQPK